MHIIIEVIKPVSCLYSIFLAMSLGLQLVCLILHYIIITMEINTSEHFRRLTRRKSERYCLICWAMLMSKSNSARTIGAFSLISRRSASRRISFSLSAPVTPLLTFRCCKTHTSTKYRTFHPWINTNFKRKFATEMRQTTETAQTNKYEMPNST